MDYSEVSSTFSKLVETHFLQRCPPLPRVGNKDSSAPSETPATPGTPAAPVNTAPPTPESFPECYKVPSVTLIGRGKRQLASEDGEEQRSAKRAKMDPQVSFFNLFGYFNKFSMSSVHYIYLPAYHSCDLLFLCLPLICSASFGSDTW